MYKPNRAANEMILAPSYDLQLFNEDLNEPIDPIEPIEPIEPTDPIEPVEPIDPIEPVELVAEPIEPVVEDVTKTQAFSRRLKEETERIRQEAEIQAIDRYIAKKYEGQLWNGKPITTKAEEDQALYEQSLIEAGQDPDTVQKLIDEHPDVKAARESKRAAEEGQKLWNEWLELQAEHKDVKDFNQIPQEVYDLAKSKRIYLLDAYNRVHIKKVKLETEQETIRKINKNATSSPGSASSGGVIHKSKPVDEMTAEEFEAYREEVRKQRKDY